MLRDTPGCCSATVMAWTGHGVARAARFGMRPDSRDTSIGCVRRRTARSLGSPNASSAASTSVIVCGRAPGSFASICTTISSSSPGGRSGIASAGGASYTIRSRSAAWSSPANGRRADSIS